MLNNSLNLNDSLTLMTVYATGPWLLCFNCDVALCLFLKMTWVSLLSVIVAFPGHIHLLYGEPRLGRAKAIVRDY